MCKDRATAEKVAAGGRLDAITMDGDLIRSKGTISGGYQDAQRSKIRSYHKVGGRVLVEGLQGMNVRNRKEEVAPTGVQSPLCLGYSQPCG